jgi:hypothetical protein
MKKLSAIAATCCVFAMAAASAGAAKPEQDGLQRKLKHPSVPGQLEEALAWVGAQSGHDVKVDWETLEARGVTPQTRIRLSTPRATASQLVDMILLRAARPGKPLSWFADDGTIYVSSQKRVLLIRSGTITIDGSIRARPRRREVPRARRAGGVTEYSFDRAPLKDVITFFRASTGVNFHVNWNSLNLVGIDRQTPVSLEVRNVSASKALDMILKDLNSGRGTFDSVYWVVDRGVVSIATGTALNNKTRTRVYDISDLLVVVRNFEAPETNLGRIQNVDEDGGGSHGDDEGGLFNDDDDDDDEDDEEEMTVAERRQKIRDNLVSIITDAIGPQMWAPNGKGSIRIMNDKLVVTQTQLGFKLLGQSFGN